MKSKSQSLFHFTESVETLKIILQEGFWPRYCIEDTRWVGQPETPNVAVPMVSFCDIPLSRISDHVDFYGEYGLGMSRDWALKSDINPILYVAGDNSLTKEFIALSSHIGKLTAEDKSKAQETLRYILAYLKPAVGKMLVEGKSLEKEFYLESEWRHDRAATA